MTKSKGDTKKAKFNWWGVVHKDNGELWTWHTSWAEARRALRTEDFTKYQNINGITVHTPYTRKNFTIKKVVIYA